MATVSEYQYMHQPTYYTSREWTSPVRHCRKAGVPSSFLHLGLITKLVGILFSFSRRERDNSIGGLLPMGTSCCLTPLPNHLRSERMTGLRNNLEHLSGFESIERAYLERSDMIKVNNGRYENATSVMTRECGDPAYLASWEETHHTLSLCITNTSGDRGNISSAGHFLFTDPSAGICFGPLYRPGPGE